jgi:hypothetical protein
MDACAKDVCSFIDNVLGYDRMFVRDAACPAMQRLHIRKQGAALAGWQLA